MKSQFSRQSLAICGALLAISAQAESTSQQELPLKPSRTIAFTVDEGTDMSIDVSPDGQTIVFDLVGDLYTLPIDGGRATALTWGIAWDEAPRYSPDGRSIAFGSDRNGAENVWIMDADGRNARRVSPFTNVWYPDPQNRMVTHPRWSPDGKVLVVHRSVEETAPGQEAEPGLMNTGVQFFLDIASEAWRPVFGNAENLEFATHGGAFDPRGESIWFVKYPLKFYTGLSFGPARLTRMSLRDGSLFSIPNPAGRNDAYDPVVSPNGQYLLYVSRSRASDSKSMGTWELRILNLSDSTALRNGTAIDSVLVPSLGPETISARRSRVSSSYAFTPDARSVVYVAHGKFKRIDLLTGSTREIPFSADVRAEAAPRTDYPRRLNDGPFVARQLRDVEVSADRRTQAFTVLGRVWVQRGNGAPKRITTNEVQEYGPAISADGRTIAFATWSDLEGGAIWQAPVSGGTATRLTSENAVYLSPRWTPDGTRIVALVGPTTEKISGGWLGSKFGESFRLAWVATTGGPVNFVGNGTLALAARGAAPLLTVSPDGTRVFITQDLGSDSRTYVLKSFDLTGKDDADERWHGRVVGGGPQGVPSPDGKWLAIQRSYNIVIVPMPAASKMPGDTDVPLIDVRPSNRDPKVIPVTLEGGVNPRWSPDGTTLSWHWANTRYEAPTADIVSGRPFRTQSNEIRLRVERKLPKGTLLLRGARVITMSARGVQRIASAGHNDTTVKTDPIVIERGDILVTGRRISAVGPSGSLRVPAGTTTLELSGKTVVPGYIPMHEHLLGRKLGAVPRDQSIWYAAMLAHGMTTVRDPGESYNRLPYDEQIEAGGILGPRWFGGLQLLHVRNSFMPEYEDIASLAAARQVVRKHKGSGAVLLKDYGFRNRMQRQWLSIAAREEGMHLIIDSGGYGLSGMLQEAMDGYTSSEHSLGVFGAMYGDAIGVLGRIGYIPSPQMDLAESTQEECRAFMLAHPEAVWRFPVGLADMVARSSPASDASALCTQNSFRASTPHHRNITALLRAGADVVFGTDALANGFNQQRAIWGSVFSGGMTNAEALRVATLNGALGLGLEEDLGSIEPGKIADLVVLNGNPLESIFHTVNIRYVVKDGVVFDGSTLDTVWPERRPFTQAIDWQRYTKAFTFPYPEQ